MLFLFLTIIQAIIAAALVGVILMQRSEGGGLGVGGSPSGLMSARGAADFLTRATTVLATLFVVLSIALAIVAVGAHRSGSIDDTLERNTAPLTQGNDDPLSAAAADEAEETDFPAADPLAPTEGQ